MEESFEGVKDRPAPFRKSGRYISHVVVQFSTTISFVAQGKVTMRIVVLTSTLFLWSSSCIALLVVTPSASNGWTNQGPQTSVQFLSYLHVRLTKPFFIPSVSWQRVITDPLEFAVILTNQVSAQASSHPFIFRPLNVTLLSRTAAYFQVIKFSPPLLIVASSQRVFLLQLAGGLHLVQLTE